MIYERFHQSLSEGIVNPNQIASQNQEAMKVIVNQSKKKFY